MKLSVLLVLAMFFFYAGNYEPILWSALSLMFLYTLFSFCKSWNHVFLMLLNLEIMSLIFISSLCATTLLTSINLELFFMFFTFAVCEASLGIAILIFFSHAKGNESMYSLLKA